MCFSSFVYAISHLTIYLLYMSFKKFLKFLELSGCFGRRTGYTGSATRIFRSCVGGLPVDRKFPVSGLAAAGLTTGFIENGWLCSGSISLSSPLLPTSPPRLETPWPPPLVLYHHPSDLPPLDLHQNILIS